MTHIIAPRRVWLHCAAMRRVLLVVLVVLLSLQWTWAAAAAYCRHEVGAGASHLGHHAHEHEGPGANEVEKSAGLSAAEVPHAPDSTDPLGADPDCGACHAGATAMLAEPAAMARTLKAPSTQTPYLRAVTEGVPERLIRPPLQRLA